MPFKTNEEKREYDKKRYEKNKTEINENYKKYYELNKEKINNNKKEYNKKYYYNNIEKFKENNNKIAQTSKRKEYLKNYNENNKDKQKEYFKIYRQNNKNKRNDYVKNRTLNDPLFKITNSIRCLIRSSIRRKNYNKNTKTFEILGCSYEAFRKHLETQFESWMNWDNYGNPKDGIYKPNKTWDIDHIIPTSSALTEKELIKLNHYTNLKPLCSYYNRFIKKANIFP